MIGKSTIALDRVTEYTKQPDGSWHADLRVPRLHVEGDSPNDCRYRMMDQFDALLAEWLTAAHKSEEPRLFGG
jgi:hypothetical protein